MLFIKSTLAHSFIPVHLVEKTKILASCGLCTSVKSVQYQVFSRLHFPVFGLNTGKYGPEKTPYLETFHAVKNLIHSFFKRTSNLPLKQDAQILTLIQD